MPRIEMLAAPRKSDDLVDGSTTEATAADHMPTDQSRHGRLVATWSGDAEQALAMQLRLVDTLVG